VAKPCFNKKESEEAFFFLINIFFTLFRKKALNNLDFLFRDLALSFVAGAHLSFNFVVLFFLELVMVNFVINFFLTRLFFLVEYRIREDSINSFPKRTFFKIKFFDLRRNTNLVKAKEPFNSLGRTFLFRSLFWSTKL
jgi:hypothetical protein